MTQSQDTDLAALEGATSRWCDALDTIEDGQWAMATPCTDWNVAALVDHVTGGNWFTSRILDGRSAEGAMDETMALFGGSSVSCETALASANEQLAAFHRPGVLHRHHHHVAGEVTGRQVLRLRIHDLTVHAWDLGQAVAPPASIPSELLRWGRDELATDGSLTARHFATGPADPGTSDDDEGAYLRRFGR